MLVHPALPPLERNDLIVRADVMIAAPKGREQRRSGTWTTIRHRVKTGRGITIFWPDGTSTVRG